MPCPFWKSKNCFLVRNLARILVCRAGHLVLARLDLEGPEVPKLTPEVLSGTERWLLFKYRELIDEIGTLLPMALKDTMSRTSQVPPNLASKATGRLFEAKVAPILAFLKEDANPDNMSEMKDFLTSLHTDDQETLAMPKFTRWIAQLKTNDASEEWLSDAIAAAYFECQACQVEEEFGGKKYEASASTKDEKSEDKVRSAERSPDLSWMDEDDKSALEDKDVPKTETVAPKA